MQNLMRLFLLPLLVATCPVLAADRAIDLSLAQSYFDEAAFISDIDEGILWGRPLYGPMLFVDQETRMVVANEPDTKGALVREGRVFVGELPLKINIANTSVVWSGKEWTMLMWPLPMNTEQRARLMAHEMWHRIQKHLGLATRSAENGHLDRPDGRIWMRLEWRAWSRAIGSDGDDRQQAIRDAMTFRLHRRSICAGAADSERKLENNEGLAEYTGVVLAGWSPAERVKQIQADLKEAEKIESFVRSFAYHTRPVIGVLLDEAKTKWTSTQNSSADLALRLQAALKIRLPKGLAALANDRMKAYGGSEILAEEKIREGRRQKRLAAARAKFIDGPTLRIRLVNMNIQFDPRTLQPLDDVGTIYPALRVTDVWGTLEVEESQPGLPGGALLGSDWKSVTVSVSPDWDGKATERKGEWKLDLKWPWRIEPAKKAGNWIVTR